MREDKHMSQFDWNSFEGADVMFGWGCRSWCEIQLKHDEKKHISLRRHWRVVPIISKMRMNYSCIIEIKSKHFQFFASIFIIFHLSPNDDFLFLFEFLRQINFHYFSSPSDCRVPSERERGEMRMSFGSVRWSWSRFMLPGARGGRGANWREL